MNLINHFPVTFSLFQSEFCFIWKWVWSASQWTWKKISFLLSVDTGNWRWPCVLVTIRPLSIGCLFVCLFVRLKLQRCVVIYFILSLWFCKIKITNTELTKVIGASSSFSIYLHQWATENSRQLTNSSKNMPWRQLQNQSKSPWDRTISQNPRAVNI